MTKKSSNVFLLSVLLTLVRIFSFGQSNNIIPAEWSKDFRIVVYSKGGKQDIDTKITFTNDVCQYSVKKDSQSKRSQFKITESERKEILAKLLELKVNEIRLIKSEKRVKAKNSNGFCLYGNKTLCLEDSGESSIHEEDRTNFHLAYQYLITFAAQKMM